MKIFPFASSSTGNATLVQAKETRILIDCGITLRLLKSTLDTTNLPQAVFITHEHSDHIQGAGPIGRNLKIPLYMHQFAYNAKQSQLHHCTVNFLKALEVITFGDFKITPFSTKHDCLYSFGFIIEELPNGPSLCFLGDTGMVTKLMMDHIKQCNVAFFEADYDVEELNKYSEYSDELKHRISSNVGHLSNDQSIELVKSLDLDKIKLIIFGHLSSRTNSPEKLNTLINKNFPDYVNKFKIAPLLKPIEIL